MLTPQDDLPGHQTPGTFAQAGHGDPRFTERWWYTAHPLVGRPLILDVGFGYYPNRGVMDAFAGVTVGRTQFNFRASRRLGANPLELAVGPLRLDIAQGQRLHRLALRDNASGIAFELDFEASFPAAQEKQSRRERDGAVEEDLARVAQFGRWRGWLQVNGERHAVEPASWWGQRDRSWGIRSEMRTDWAAPPMQTHNLVHVPDAQHGRVDRPQGARAGSALLPVGRRVPTPARRQRAPPRGRVGGARAAMGR